MQQFSDGVPVEATMGWGTNANRKVKLFTASFMHSPMPKR
jgi:hypothetical protein